MILLAKKGPVELIEIAVSIGRLTMTELTADTIPPTILATVPATKPAVHLDLWSFKILKSRDYR
jgi:hypothetical protein